VTIAVFKALEISHHIEQFIGRGMIPSQPWGRAMRGR
jgi:hypothetical protein